MCLRLFLRKEFFAALLWGITAFAPAAQAAVSVGFEDVSLPASGYYNGSDGAGGFTSRGVFFPNSYAEYPPYVYWDTWACSNVVNTTDGSWTNQYAAITGKGAEGSAQYAVGYPGFSTGMSDISLPEPCTVQGAYFTNTTYAYLSMLNGYNGSKKFGGSDGTDEDWFRLTITGKDAAGVALGSRILYLADFRDPGDRPDDARTDDYILDQWTWVSLSTLGDNVKTLEFSLTSTDNDPIFGMNTPGYFALDNLTVSTAPEPCVLALLATAALGWIVRTVGRKRSR